MKRKSSDGNDAEDSLRFGARKTKLYETTTTQSGAKKKTSVKETVRVRVLEGHCKAACLG